MNFNYQLSDKVWWRPTYFSFDNKEFLKLIKEHEVRARAFVNKHENSTSIKDFEREYRILYLKECLIGEKNIDDCSMEYIEYILEEASLIPKIKFEEDVKSNVQSVLASKSVEQVEKERKKIVNMFKAIQGVFPNLVVPNLDIQKFDVNLANSIHFEIGFGLIQNPGFFRSTEAMPYGENFRYLESDQIGTELEALFAKTRDEISKMATTSSNGLDESDIEKIIKIAAEFLNRFLYIHPYSNGNGRVARILTSYLLLRLSVVPVSLTEGSQRQTYFDCLRQIHSTGNLDQPPIALATLLLERVFYSLDFFIKIILEA